MNDALVSWRITATAFFPWGSSAINRFLGRETPYIIGGYSLQITLLRVKQRTHISFAALIYKSGWISSPNNHPWAPSQLPIESLSSQYDGDVMRSLDTSSRKLLGGGGDPCSPQPLPPRSFQEDVLGDLITSLSYCDDKDSLGS